MNLLGIDPAIRNFGLAAASINLDTLAIDVKEMALVKTVNETTKQVRKSSDNMRRAGHIFEEVHDFGLKMNTALIIAEIPSGAQNSAGAISNGISIGILAGLRKTVAPIVEVQQSEVKLQVTGHKNASKEEMIEWAMEKYPHLPWCMVKVKGVMKPIAESEHMADAIAIIHAGVASPQFKQVLSLMRASLRVAA